MANTCIIEINDAGLTAADANGLRLTSPGYAVFDGKVLHVGDAAFTQARLNPRRTYDRFWSQLDQQPLNRAAGDANSHADLAYFHLRDFWENLKQDTDEVIFAVPGDFGKPQLALLLGIAQTLEIPVNGLVATAVAAAASVAGDAPRLYLDAELHRMTATQVSGGSALALGTHREVSKQGIASLYDAWATMIAERFVQDTRYDPLHQAAAEQKLYERLPEWLTGLQGREHARFELQVGQRSHHVEISITELQQAAASIYQSIIDVTGTAHGAIVLLSHTLADLPGLQAALNNRLLAPPVALQQTTVAESVLGHLDVVRSDASAPAFVTRLPGAISGAPQAPAASTAKQTKQTPSHLLFEWKAYPINGAPLVLEAGPPRGLRLGETPKGAVITLRAGAAVLEPGAKAGTLKLNGDIVDEESPLSVGDAIVLDGAQEMRLISLVSGDGTA